MLNRFSFPLIAVFWVTMNALLWRSEFGGDRRLGAVVPVELVWQKILTAPDDSAMEISMGGKKIGYCHWLANIGETLATGKTSSSDYEPEGMIREPTGYTLDLEGNLLAAAAINRLRFTLHVAFATNQVWQEASLRVAVRPTNWEIHASRVQESVRVKTEEEGNLWQRKFSFGELRDPQNLLREFGIPIPPGLFGPAAGPAVKPALDLGLNWEARNDWLKIGHSQARVYRLQARLLDRYQIVVVVSRVGELLRVELPDNLVLVNEAMMNF